VSLVAPGRRLGAFAFASSDLLSLLSLSQGFVRPAIPDGGAAAVFAIYSDARVLQVVAFSTDLRRSLLTVLGRRPDKAYYYK